MVVGRSLFGKHSKAIIQNLIKRKKTGAAAITDKKLSNLKHSKTQLANKKEQEKCKTRKKLQIKELEKK